MFYKKVQFGTQLAVFMWFLKSHSLKKKIHMLSRWENVLSAVYQGFTKGLYEVLDDCLWQPQTGLIPPSLVLLLVTATCWPTIYGWYCTWAWMTQDCLMTTKKSMGDWCCNLSAQGFLLLFRGVLFCGRLFWNFVPFGALRLAVP